jgi:hypothetical protein
VHASLFVFVGDFPWEYPVTPGKLRFAGGCGFREGLYRFWIVERASYGVFGLPNIVSSSLYLESTMTYSMTRLIALVLPLLLAVPAHASSPEELAAACERGEGESCKNLGFNYENGLGVEKDAAKAVELYKKACGLDASLAGCRPARPHEAQRDEVPSMVDGIRVAQVAYHAAFDVYVLPISPWPRAVEDLSPDLVDFSKNQGAEPTAEGVYDRGSGYNHLGWSADAPVRGTYWVEPHPTEGFVVYGAIDADGDGVPAIYKATKDHWAKPVTKPDVY